MKIVKEFREFAIKGNMIDMAVGIIIGAAFGQLINSLVKDVIMPPIGVLLGRIDFSNFMLVIQKASTASDGSAIPAVTLQYGKFISEFINFLIIAWCVFMIIRIINRLKRKEIQAAPQAPAGPNEVQLLGEIRDILKSGK
jgi:large conductance mechanosensitive channel